MDKLSGERELYDLENDPYELRNIAEENRVIVNRLSQQLEKIKRSHNLIKDAPSMSNVSVEQLKKTLKSLGYL